MWVPIYASICTAHKVLLPLFLKTTQPQALFTLSLLSKEVCLYTGADWLGSSASQGGERSIVKMWIKVVVFFFPQHWHWNLFNYTYVCCFFIAKYWISVFWVFVRLYNWIDKLSTWWEVWVSQLGWNQTIVVTYQRYDKIHAPVTSFSRWWSVYTSV